MARRTAFVAEIPCVCFLWLRFQKMIFPVGSVSILFYFREKAGNNRDVMNLRGSRAEEDLVSGMKTIRCIQHGWRTICMFAGNSR